MTARDHGENYMELGLLLVSHLQHNPVGLILTALMPFTIQTSVIKQETRTRSFFPD